MQAPFAANAFFDAEIYLADGICATKTSLRAAGD